MEYLINKNVKQIGLFEMRKIADKAAKYEDSITLALGESNFPTPNHIKESAKYAIDNNKTYYTTTAGIEGLRAAVSSFMSKKYNLSYDPEDEIIITAGAGEGIDVSLRTILSEGDEVILPGPTYSAYEPIIRVCGAIPVYVDTIPNDFRMNGDMIKTKITDKTKCVILPTPNPTCCIQQLDDLESIADVLKSYD